MIKAGKTEILETGPFYHGTKADLPSATASVLACGTFARYATDIAACPLGHKRGRLRQRWLAAANNSPKLV